MQYNTRIANAEGWRRYRAERLAHIDEMVADGTLTIRQMTPKERKTGVVKLRKPKKRRKVAGPTRTRQ